jgi:hypothetical protein
VGEHCRNWKGDERCGNPAEFIVWGKLFSPDALGPRCYDCAAEQVGHHGLRPGNPDGYAIYHLAERDRYKAEHQALRDAIQSEIERLRNEATELEAGARYPAALEAEDDADRLSAILEGEKDG